MDLTGGVDLAGLDTLDEALEAFVDALEHRTVGVEGLAIVALPAWADHVLSEEAAARGVDLQTLLLALLKECYTFH